MPKWGLNSDQRNAWPWGLDPALLKPSKTITDPIHGDVYITEIERRLVDSPPMQRLRRVRQLGTTHLVYPSATHSRFSHALGTLRSAQDLLDAVADNRRGPRHSHDLFDEWEAEQDLPSTEASVTVADARFAEATVLARLGALLHDLCHVPLGHTIEDDLKVLTPHDRNRVRFRLLWDGIDEEARTAIDDGESLFSDALLTLKEELERLILSKEFEQRAADGEELPESSYPFVGDIVGNTICADLVDYLQRDHAATGLPIALGKRFMDDFYVMSSDHAHYAKRMVVRISRYGHPREDVITELVKYLRYRYELTERVLTHHAKVSADAMIGKLLEMWSDSIWIEEAQSRYPTVLSRFNVDSDPDEVKRALFLRFPRRGGPGQRSTSTDDPQLRESRAIAEIDERAIGRLEGEFLQRSDDGLLEHLMELGDSIGGTRYRAIGALAEAVLNRKLFKLIGRADSRADQALAEEKYGKFGKPERRRQLEEQAAQLANLRHGWQVVVWLPHPFMRLKVAEVLVDDGTSVAPLERVSPDSDSIVNLHQKLWGVSIFATADLLEKPHALLPLLMSLKTTMDIAVVTRDGTPVKTVNEGLIDALGDFLHLPTATRGLLREAVELEPAAYGSHGTFKEALEQLWRVARENGVPGAKGRPPADLWPSP